MAGKPHPLQSASLPSVLTFSWANKLIFNAWRQKGLTEEDVWDTPADEDCRNSCAVLEAAIAAQGGPYVSRDDLRNGQLTLLSIDTKRALFWAFKRPLIISACFMLAYLSFLCLGSFYILRYSPSQSHPLR